MAEKISFTSIEEQGKDFRQLAIDKLDAERKEMKPSGAVEVMYIEVANALKNFCEQDNSFAKVVYKTKRSFNDCMQSVAKGVGRGISDIDAYRKAIQFYFPNANIEYLIKITIDGDEPDEKYINKEEKKPKPKVDNKKKAVNNKTKGSDNKPKQSDNKKKTAEKPKEEPKTIQLSLF